MAIRIIKATKSMEKPEQKKLRVCAYARVSTDDQESSYEAQVEHYTNYIQRHPDMEFVGMYADEGILPRRAREGVDRQSPLQEHFQTCPEYGGLTQRHPEAEGPQNQHFL